MEELLTKLKELALFNENLMDNNRVREDENLSLFMKRASTLRLLYNNLSECERELENYLDMQNEQ